MIVVRNVFIAKPGSASKLAAQVKSAGGSSSITSFRVMTDLTGEFNRVILEFEVASITDFEAAMNDYQTNQAFREKMKGYTDLYITGSREILQIV